VGSIEEMKLSRWSNGYSSGEEHRKCSIPGSLENASKQLRGSLGRNTSKDLKGGQGAQTGEAEHRGEAYGKNRESEGGTNSERIERVGRGTSVVLDRRPDVVSGG
jgi:hypothetical protein